jgi:hypothetical protein
LDYFESSQKSSSTASFGDFPIDTQPLSLGLTERAWLKVEVLLAWDKLAVAFVVLLIGCGLRTENESFLAVDTGGLEAC